MRRRKSKLLASRAAAAQDARASALAELDRSCLFLADWYEAKNAEVIRSDEPALDQYLDRGGRDGRAPHPLFDSKWYLERYGDVAQEGVNPLLHYLRYGWREGRDPHPLFDTAWYLERYGQAIPEGSNPLTDYVTVGWREGRWPNPLFDGRWYLDWFGARLDADQSPLAHYLERGAGSGCDPNALFDGAWYRQINLDVAAARRDPLEHYLNDGAREGRDPHPLFYSAWYAGHNPESDGYRTPLAHYLHSAATDLLPNPLFDDAFYRATYLDVTSMGETPLSHFVSWGAREGRCPCALFDTAWYLATYGDVAASGRNALEHFLTDGAFEGRRPHPKFDQSWFLAPRNRGSVSDGGPLGEWLRYGRARGEAWPLAGHVRFTTAGVTLADLCDLERDERVEAAVTDLVFSILTPTFDTDPRWLRELYQSLRNQTYTGWRWVVSDDGSTRSDTLATLRIIAAGDDRVTLLLHPDGGGISAASNRALAAAQGEYIALVDHDDVLARSALASVRARIVAQGAIDIAYTDECKLAEDYTVYDVFLKPGWSPILLQNTMYIGHLTVYNAEFLRALGGFRTAFDGTQDYDLALRAAVRATRVAHVPCIAYLWRAIAGSSAFRLTEKDYALVAQASAVREAIAARASDATVKPGPSLGYWRTDYPLSAEPKLLSYVIPTAGRLRSVRGASVDLLLNCIDSLERSRFYARQEFVVVHNGDLSSQQMTALQTRDNVRLVAYEDKIFNLANKINLGVDAAVGEYVCLLNDDVEAITSGGGETLIGFMERHPDVGATGPLCLFEDGRVQHDGVMLLEQGPSHAGLFQHPNRFGDHGYLRCRREVFGLTGAMLFVRRALYLSLGGFDRRLPLNYNDIDFCLRLRASGYSCVVDPEVQVYHFESASKVGTYRCEKEEFYRRWPGLTDPYFNAGFDQRDPGFVLRRPPAVKQYADPVTFERWLDGRIARRSADPAGGALPSVTIAIAVYNGRAEQLEEMLRSALMQTYTDCEILIVDDGSTHSQTCTWLDAVARRGDVRLVQLERNSGIAAAQKALLETARGEWFVPLDSDDFLTIDAVQIMIAAAQAHPLHPIFYSDEFKSDVGSNKFAPFFKSDFDPVKITNCCYVTHLMMIKTQFLKDIDAYSDLRATWCHDWDTTLRALDTGVEPIHVPELLYAWRINPGSTASIATGTKPDASRSQRFVLERTIAARGSSHNLRVEPNMLGPQTGMWALVADTPVDEVVVRDANAFWDAPIGGRTGSLWAAADAGAWIALLHRAEGETGHTDLLALSAVARWDKRVGVVSGVLARGGDRVLWSGGVFTKVGVVDPHADGEWVGGGYHGALYCQRCVDVAAPVDVLIRTEHLRTALTFLSEHDLTLTGENLMVILGILAARAGWLVAVTPHVKTLLDRSRHHLVPLDRSGLSLDPRMRTTRSRWYADHLSPLRPFHPAEFEGESC